MINRGALLSSLFSTYETGKEELKKSEAPFLYKTVIHVTLESRQVGTKGLRAVGILSVQ